MHRSLQVQNYTFHYCATGSSTNPPILWLHGFMGDRYEFDQAIAAISHQFYCLAIDLPGHGETKVVGGDRNYEMQPTAYGIMQFLEALNVGQCHLIGYSMGGRLALYLALHFPKYFKKVILESASSGLKTELERMQRSQSDRQLAQKLASCDLSSFLMEWYSQPLFTATKAHPNFEQMLARRLSNAPSNLAKSLWGMSTGQQPSLWQDLPNLQVPLFLMAGELDRKFVAVNTDMASLCGNCAEICTQLEIIPNCGHNIHFENAEVFTEQVTRFILM